MYLHSDRASAGDMFLDVFPSFKIFNNIVGSYRTFVTVSVKSNFVHKKNIVKKDTVVVVSLKKAQHGTLQSKRRQINFRTKKILKIGPDRLRNAAKMK